MNSSSNAERAAAAKPRAFSSFASGEFRLYFFCSTAAMMADNIEHVISYWVIFQKFQSPALGGFAVVSHWIPFLLFAGFSGALADRFDVRRLIQLGMAMLCGVSICWGYLFLSDTLTLWKAMALLVVHGFAGVIWIPASQVLIHQIVRVEQLPSAIRLTATGRYLGFLVGPAIGLALLMRLGSGYGIVVNSLIYIPMFIWMMGAPYGKASAGWRPSASTPIGISQVWTTMKILAGSRVLLSMTLLASATAFFVGNAYGPQLPGFARDLGYRSADFSYAALVAADAAGGLVGGLLLERGAMLQPSPRTAFILAMIWCAALIGFAQSTVYGLAICLLFVAGFMELAFNAMAQALVQLHAPAAIRGRVIGVFSMSMGMRTFSGLTIGLLGARVGIHNSVTWSAGVLLVVIATMFYFFNVRTVEPA